MDVLSFDALQPGYPSPVATIGNFDGVHCGHQFLIQQLVERARASNGTATVITFDPHPLQVLAPGNAPRQIQTLTQRLQSIASLGVQLTLVIRFDLQFARINARHFVHHYLCDKLGIREIYVGSNFAFGHRREGSFSLLKEIGGQRGFHVGKVNQRQFRSIRVSSTAIRQAVIAGQVSFARRLLGRPFLLEGTIVHGDSIGSELNAPTANLETENELVPRRGVYVSVTKVGGMRYRSVTNIGVRPTINADNGDAHQTIETHLLDYSGELCGEKIGLEFLLRLRDEKRFESREDLMAQIQVDMARTRRLFGWVEKKSTGRQ